MNDFLLMDLRDQIQEVIPGLNIRLFNSSEESRDHFEVLSHHVDAVLEQLSKLIDMGEL